MDANLQHEDLLIRLRAKLNEEKIKLWEEPYLVAGQETSDSLKVLAKKYATELSIDYELTLSALLELQVHSVDRSKANEQFKETGFATFRIRATIPGEKPTVLKVEKKLSELGSELIDHVATQLSIDKTRIKLIHNGKLLKPTPSLEVQGVKNGSQIMALVMAETAEESQQEDRLYMEMKRTREDAALLSEHVDDLDEDYIKLEDQTGKSVDLPPEERRSLMVGLALHERGRAAIKQKDYTLALVLLLEADRQLSECRSSLLSCVDNAAILQLDVSWCYLCLQLLPRCSDAAARLQQAQGAFTKTYGDKQERLIAVKGTAANERVLFMRLYLLQGIVAYHQNKREEARRLLDDAQQELNALRVDDTSVAALTELGWSRGQARAGLRAARGQLDQAHHYLAEKCSQREAHRRQGRDHREAVLFAGLDRALVAQLTQLGHSARAAAAALRDAGGDVTRAAALLQTSAYADSDSSGDTSESGDSAPEPDDTLVAELVGMGYCLEDSKTALKMTRNKLEHAVELLVAGTLLHTATEGNQEVASTSAAAPTAPAPPKRRKRDKKKREREQALRRLKSAIKGDEDDYLDSSLTEEEFFLAQYKSLL